MSDDLASRVARTALVLDIVLVIVFATIGRASHGENLSPGGLLRTSVPFLCGLVVGWVIAVVTRLRALSWSGGLVIVAATVAVGMLVRWATGQGVAVSFVIVASCVLTLFLVGWRLVRLAFRARRRRA